MRDLLDQLFQEKPIIAQQFKAKDADIFTIWPSMLCRLGLNTLANHSSVIDLEHKQLRLSVTHSVFLQELKLRQGLWLPALEVALKEANYPCSRIVKVRFLVQN